MTSAAMERAARLHDAQLWIAIARNASTRQEAERCTQIAIRNLMIGSYR